MSPRHNSTLRVIIILGDITFSYYIVSIFSHYFNICFYVLKINSWALTHPLSVKEYEKVKKKQMKPDFLDMVPWYSGYVYKMLFFFFFLHITSLFIF